MKTQKTQIDFKYDTLKFKGRKEFRDICDEFIQYFRKMNGNDPGRIVLPKDVYLAAREQIKKVQYATDDAKIYYDSIPVFGRLVDD